MKIRFEIENKSDAHLLSKILVSVGGRVTMWQEWVEGIVIDELKKFVEIEFSDDNDRIKVIK